MHVLHICLISCVQYYSVHCIQTFHQEVTLPCSIRPDSVNELFGGINDPNI